MGDLSILDKCERCEKDKIEKQIKYKTFLTGNPLRYNHCIEFEEIYFYFIFLCIIL